MLHLWSNLKVLSKAFTVSLPGSPGLRTRRDKAAKKGGQGQDFVRGFPVSPIFKALKELRLDQSSPEPSFPRFRHIPRQF